MVQKAFLALILADIEQNYIEVQQKGGRPRYDRELMEQLAAKGFKNSDAQTNSLLLKQFGP